MKNKTVVIAGNSVSAYFAFQYLEKSLSDLREPVDLVLISDKSDFYVSDLLPQLLCGQINLKDLIFSFREKISFRPGARYLKTEIINIDFESKQLLTEKGSLVYDYLILAPSADIVTSNKQQNFDAQYLIVTPADILKLKDRIINNLEEAIFTNDPAIKTKLLTFTVTGSGEKAIEIAVSLSDVLNSLLRTRYYELSKTAVKVNLFKKEGLVNKSKSPFYNSKLLYNLNKKNITLCSEQVNQNNELAAGTLIYTDAEKSSSLIELLKKNYKNFVPNTDLYCKVENLSDVYLIGELAHCLDLDESIQKSVNFYNLQTETCAFNVCSRINNNPEKPLRLNISFDFLSLGTFNSLVKIKDICFDGIGGWFVHRFSYIFAFPGIKFKIFALFRFIFDMLGVYEFNSLVLFDLKRKDLIRK